MTSSEKIDQWRQVHLKNLDSLVFQVKKNLSCPCVLILTGAMGAGKTTFVQHFMRTGDREGELSLSPTYSLIHERGGVLHGDFYRLESEQELIHLELELYWEDKDYFLVEWGKDYLSFLREILGEGCSYYELEIEMPETSELHRTFSLFKLSHLSG